MMTEEHQLHDVIAGSYDGYIYGLSALIETSPQSESGEFEYKATLVQQFIERAHSSHVKVLSCRWPHLATAGDDDVINLYNLETLREVGSLHQHLTKIQHLQFLPSSHLLSLSEDGQLVIWRTRDWRPIRTLSLCEKGKSFTHFSIHPSHKVLFAVSPTDSIISMCDLRTARCAFTMKLADKPLAIECSPTGEHYILVHTCTVSLYSVQSPTAKFSVQLREEAEINSVLFLSGELIALGGEMECVKLVTLRADTGDKVGEAEFVAHEDRVKSLKGNLPFLFSSSSDGIVKVWNVQCGNDGIVSKLSLIGEINLAARLTCLSVSAISDSELQVIDAKRKDSSEETFQKLAILYSQKRNRRKNLKRAFTRNSGHSLRFLLKRRLNRAREQFILGLK